MTTGPTPDGSPDTWVTALGITAAIMAAIAGTVVAFLTAGRAGFNFIRVFSLIEPMAITVRQLNVALIDEMSSTVIESKNKITELSAAVAKLDPDLTTIVRANVGKLDKLAHDIDSIALAVEVGSLRNADLARTVDALREKMNSVPRTRRSTDDH